MSSSLSPYALLSASKPRHVPTVTTAYDLFSTAQMAPSSTLPVREYAGASTDSSFNTQHSNRIFETVPTSHLPHSIQRTHYIADIHARHNAAGRFLPAKHI